MPRKKPVFCASERDCEGVDNGASAAVQQWGKEGRSWKSRSFGWRASLNYWSLKLSLSLQLNSVYEGKLPVSRAKMASITKQAIKSAKVSDFSVCPDILIVHPPPHMIIWQYYKHIVMLVEKFISKVTDIQPVHFSLLTITLSPLQCASEYKVPGLYVIDSIVRQSRHQNAEKDVYGPRFSKNFEKTFLSLFQCPPDDKVGLEMLIRI